MKRKIRFIFPLLLLSLPLTGCDFITIKDKEENEEVIVEKYYKDFDFEETGLALATNIQKLMFEKHTKWISYDQVDAYYSKTANRNSIEAIKDGSNINQYFYTGKEATGKAGSREHVWDCSSSNNLWSHDGKDAAWSQTNVDFEKYVGGGSDLFHIRSCNTSVNSARSNASFVDFDDPEYSEYKSQTTTSGEYGGKYKLRIYEKRCEVDDAFKGDVARILLYVWTHYADRGFYPEGSVESGGHTYNFRNFVGTLPLNAAVGYTIERTKEKLMEWNKLDPVSEVEKLRNTTVQKIQGNRNIFVDHPELVDQLFE